MSLENPQSFIIREECHKATWQHGFRRVLGEADGWAGFGSTTAQGTIWLAAESAQGPWFLALDHPGVVTELALPSAGIAGPGIDRFSFPTLTALYAILPRLYQLSTSLPDAPLKTFHQQTAKLPQTTEAERLVIQRIGQGLFRASLLEYWGGACAVTGLDLPAVLRASHAKPWADCGTDAERLDVFNGFLLAAHLDALFDCGLITFADDGLLVPSRMLTASQASLLHLASPSSPPLRLRWITPSHLTYLAWHQQEVFRSS